VVVHPSGAYVYVANRDDNTISQFTWLLEPLAPATVVNGTTAAALTTDPDGKFLYGTNWQYGTVTMFSIKATGALNPLTPSSVPAGGFPYGFGSVIVDATGQFVYVANLFNITSYQSGEVALFRIALTGPLQPLGTFRAGNRPTSVTTTNPLDYQAQQDMLQRAAQEPRFGATPLYGTCGKNRYQGSIVDRETPWEIRSMDFPFAGGRIVTMYHATSRADATVRFTQYCDPDNNGTCTEWISSSR
jgi:hypothetical protein